MQEKPKNREWVKNAAIIFLVVLLVLTFFSNTIMNRSLPEVATQEVDSGSIVARVRGTGTVTANSNTQVKMDKTRVIRSVLVKVGQQVEPGDVLFTLGEGSSEEIDAAEEKLRELQTSYNRTAANFPEGHFGADQNRLSHLADALSEAEKAYIAAEKAAKLSASKKTQLAKAEQERDAAIERRDAAKKLYNKLLKELSGEDYSSDKLKDLQTRQKNILNELRNNKESSIYHVEDFYLDGGHLISTPVWEDSYYVGRGKIVRQITLTQRAITDLSGDNTDPDNDPEDTGNTGNDDGLTDDDETISSDGNGALVQEKSSNSNNTKAQENNSSQQMSEDALAKKAAEEEAAKKAAEEEAAKKAAEEEAAKKAAEEEAAKKAAEEEAAKKAAEEEAAKKAAEEEAAKKAAEEEPKSPQTGDDSKALERRKKQLTKLKEALDDYDELQNSIDAMWTNTSLTEARKAYDDAVLDVEKWETAYQVLLTSNNPQSEAYKSAKQAYEYAEEEYLSAKQALDEKYTNNQQQVATYNIDLADTWQQIEKAKQKLADLTGGEESQILARVAGTIQTIDAAPGDTKQKDDVLATIEAPDMGYTLSFSVTNEQAGRLRPGDTATVSNFYWGTEVVATLTSIKIDQKNPQTNKILTFDVTGNVTSGQELTVSVGQKSATFDLIVPSSAIRSDANGSFVLKVESKNSPLGNRYIARRVPVDILASDDTNSAVTADLSFGDYVITTSSAPLKNGELVRLANS